MEQRTFGRLALLAALEQFSWCVPDYLPRPFPREDEVARAIDRQLNLIAAQSLLKAASDLAPSRSVTDSGSVEGKRVGVSWR